MTGPEFEKAIVALACYQIGHKELYRGMSAVAMCFQNAVIEGRAESLYQIAVKYIAGDLSQDYPDSRDPEFQKLLMAVEASFQGNLIDKTGGATRLLDSSGLAYLPETLGPPLYSVGQLHFYR